MLTLEPAQASPSKATLLYRRGQSQQWNSEDLPWHLAVRLTPAQQRSGARVLSQVLHGERASFQIITQLQSLNPDPSARLFLEGQARDEARHVEVFSRYIGLLGEEQPPGQNFARLLEGMLALPTVEEKLVGMHILVEGMALELFHAMVVAIDEPLLQALLRRVFIDESRHVAFGLDHTRQAVARLDREGCERVATQGGRYAALAGAMIHEERENAACFGLDVNVVQDRTLRVLFRRLQQIGLLNALSLF